MIAATTDELVQSLRELADGETPHPPAVVKTTGDRLVFSGQGSQWAAMGAQLLATETGVRHHRRRGGALIAKQAGFR